MFRKSDNYEAIVSKKINNDEKFFSKKIIGGGHNDGDEDYNNVEYSMHLK